MATRAKSLGSWFDKRFQDWLRRHLPATDSITLNRRIIFILPTRQGMLFVAAAAVVFVAAINYAISLGFALAFLMASLFIISILHGFNNLNGLELTGLPVQSAFVGEDIGMNVLLSRNSRRRHEALELRFPGSNITRANVVSHDQEKVSIYIKATRRGRFGAPRLRVESTFPLGLTRAWSIVDLNLHSLIYPKPVRFQLERLNRSGGDTGDAVVNLPGSEDFYGLRAYQAGDSIKQIAWKSLARGQGIHVKQFVETADKRLWLDWDMFYGLSTEDRLSRLCYGVLKLSCGNSPFGLRLPDVRIDPALGAAHKQKLLRTLALYQMDSNPKEQD